MRILRIAILATILTIVAGVAFSPQFLFADFQMLVARQLSNTVLMVETVAATAGAIYPNTVSGSDSASICLSGGSLAAGVCSESRGALVTVNGKQHGSQPDNLQLSAGSAGSVFFRTAGSGRFTYDALGNVIQQTAGGTHVMAPLTATAAATPAAATNFCNGNCVVPTAAANAAVFIGAGTTPTPGAQIQIYNSNGTNLIRAKAVGASTINGVTAGGWIGLAANTSMRCTQISATDLVCNGYSGGAMPTPAGP